MVEKISHFYSLAGAFLFCMTFLTILTSSIKNALIILLKKNKNKNKKKPIS